MAIISYQNQLHVLSKWLFVPVLPQLNPSEIETIRLFSQLGAKAIEYGFTAREVRGTTSR